MNIQQLQQSKAAVAAVTAMLTKRADTNPQIIAGLGAAIALIEQQLKLSRALYESKTENEMKQAINNFLTGVNNA